MTTQTEALKLALEYGSFPQGSGVIRAIKEALAQHDSVQAQPEPEQEPVAYINVEERKLEWAKPMSWNTPTVVKLERIPLYTKEKNFV